MKSFSARNYEKNITRYKIFVAILVIAVVGAGFYSYVLYIDTVKKSRTIADQGQTILEKNSVVSQLETNVRGLEENARKQTNQIRNLGEKISQQESSINQLSDQLGLTQSELEELTPVVKKYYAMGVSGTGKGIVIPLEVKLVTGSGILSVNIKNVDLLSGTQESVRTSSQVASQFTGTSLSGKDLTVSFINELPDVVTLDGPSAGAAITVTIIAAIQNRTLDSRVLMTGTIENNGFVGEVGGVSEKAVAARDFGAAAFFVPQGQSVTIPNIRIIEMEKVSDAFDLVFS